MEILNNYFSEFTSIQTQQFAALQSLYEDWNQKINVISRKDISGLYERHILHSLSIAASFDFPDGAEIIDLGTGGGFPGVPLAIYFPNVKFRLVDSIGKKLKVIEAVASEIGLKNVTTIHSRVENAGLKKADYIVSRAVAPLKDLWYWSKPLININVKDKTPANGLICFKGGDLNQEISESGLRPGVIAVKEIFEEDFFLDKYILYVKR